MTNLAAVTSDESTIFVLCTNEWPPRQFVLQYYQWFHDGFKFFFHCLLLLEQTIGLELYSSPCSFLFAVHLDWSLNTSADKKVKCSLYISELVFHFRLRLKLNIFFSLVPFSLEMHNKSGKKLTGKKLSVDKQFLEDVTWNFWCYSV